MPDGTHPLTQPLVTIVTPSFNQGRFIQRTMDSVLAQDYPHIEYLVIDGGSTDETLAVLRGQGERFFWLSERDRGQAHAINKGLARARGDILAYLNSDDVLCPGAVGAVVRAFAEHPDADVLYGEAEYIDEEDRVLGRYPTHDYSWARLRQYCFLCQPATFWRAHTARRVGPLNEGLHCCLDYEYWLRIALAGGTFRRVPDLLARSRIYDATKTMSLREKIYRETIAIQRDLLGLVELGPFYGLWRHRLSDRNRKGLLRRLPLATPAMATLHFLWHNRACPWRALGGLCRGMKRMLAPRQSAGLLG